MENGWIKLYRNLMDDALWRSSTPELKVVMVTLLMMANHETNEWLWNGQKYKCEPGQMVTSVASIKEKCGKGVSDKAVRCALDKLEKYGFTASKRANTGTLITIVNWRKYQATDEQKGKQKGKRGANEGQAKGKRGATNNNDNNDKNERNNTGSALLDGEQPVWESEGFASEKEYIKFLRGE